MKIIIAGTRTFDDYQRLKQVMNRITWKMGPLVVMTGAQRTWDKVRKEFIGADFLGERWALEEGYVVKNYHANWRDHGKSAGPKRNERMISQAGQESMLVAFWDGISPGTEDVIKRARFRGIPVKVILF